MLDRLSPLSATCLLTCTLTGIPRFPDGAEGRILVQSHIERQKNTHTPALTRRGAREGVASPQRFLAGAKSSLVGQMPTEKGRFSSSGVTGTSWGWPYKAQDKRPRSTPIGVRSFVMALKKRNKSTFKKMCLHMLRLLFFFKFEGFQGIEPMTFDLFPTTNPHPNDLVKSRCFFITRTIFFFFRHQSKKRARFFFCAPQEWTREGVRLASHQL